MVQCRRCLRYLLVLVLVTTRLAALAPQEMPKPPAASVGRLGAQAVSEGHAWLAELLAQQQEDFNGRLDQLLARMEGLRAEMTGPRATPPKQQADSRTPGPEKPETPGPQRESDLSATCVDSNTVDVDIGEDKGGPGACPASTAVSPHKDKWRSDFQKISKRSKLTMHEVEEEVCHPSPFLSWFMRKPLDIISAVMTIMNSALLYMMLEYQGYKTRVGMGLEVDGRWRITADVMDVATLGFALAFLFELIARLAYFGKNWLREALNVFDVVVVILNVVDAFILPFVVQSDSDDMVFARVCLIIRLLRVVRLARTASIFQELRVILRTIYVSCKSLVWSMLILFLFMLMSAMCLVSALSDFVRDEGNDWETRKWVEKYYGDATKAMWTMFKITMSGGWPNWVVPLVDQVHPAYAIFFGFYVIIVVFATTRIIAALLLKHTLQVVDGEKEMMIQNQVKKKAAIAAKLEKIFHEADTSKDGTVSWDEFHDLLSTESVAAYFAALELEVHELESIFMLLDDGDGNISCQEFLSGVLRLKGQARSLDMLTVLHYIKHVSEMLQSLLAKEYEGKFEGKYEDPMIRHAVAANLTISR